MIITREFLAQYVYLESEIKRMRRRLNYYKSHPLVTEHGVVKGSHGDFPFTECHFVVCAPQIKSDEERRTAISQLVIDLEGNRQLYEDMKLDIECYIETICDLEMKEILYMKYVSGMTDGRIAERLHYDRRTIGKKIDRFLTLCESGC